MQNSLRDAAAPILTELSSSGFSTIGSDLEVCLEHAVTGSLEIRRAALERIEGLCHIKALGDLNVKMASGNDWLHLLSTLRSAARAALERANA